jgi:integrase/recombinase XerD
MRIYQRKYRTPDGEWKSGLTWWCLFFVNGVRHHESLGTRDKRAAELVAADRLRRAELKAAGIADPFEQHAEKSLEDHVSDFEATLRGRGVVEKYVRDRVGCLRAYLDATRAERLKDLDLPGASRWISTLRKSGLAARSVNGRIRALKQFGRWLVETRRVQFDPFDALRPLNEEEDRRHVRRALTPDEAVRLLQATRERPFLQAKAERKHAGVSEPEEQRLRALGATRALVYLLAMGTGLRRGELRRLRWADLDLERGVVAVPAASAKSRRDQSVPLGTALVAALQGARPADAPAQATVIPAGAFPNTLTFRRDLAAAGVAREADGRVVDFHALRTTFVSWLAAAGVHPRTAQALARHASIETTMERYTDLRLVDLQGSVEKLPLPAPETTPRKAGRPLRVWVRRCHAAGAR